MPFRTTSLTPRLLTSVPHDIERRLVNYEDVLVDLEYCIGDLMYCIANEEDEEFKNSMRNLQKDLERLADWMHDHDE